MMPTARQQFVHQLRELAAAIAEDRVTEDDDIAINCCNTLQNYIREQMTDEDFGFDSPGVN